MKKLWTALVAALALCVALVGCGGGGSKAAAPDPKADFVGTWEIVKMVEDGEETGEDELELVKSFGLNVYLELSEDGTGTLELFGQPMDLEWTATDVGKGTITMEGQTVPITLGDGRLTMEQDESSLTFEQIDPSEKVSAPADDNTGEDNTDSGSDSSAAYFGGDTIDDLNDAELIEPVIVTDDDLCRITVTAKGVYAGDPGYFFEIENKGDVDILVVNASDDWTVGGEARHATLYETVKVGEKLGSIAWFDASEVGADTSGLADVAGTIYVVDSNDYENILASYTFHVD